MISSVFDKTNPINYFLVILIFSIHYWFWFLTRSDLGFEILDLWSFLGKLSLVVVSIFLVEFMVKKNQISSKNTYAILIFICLFGVFAPEVYSFDALFTLFFLLLGLRRLLSIRSLVTIKLKIFDASFWILMASFFNAYALYFFIILALAIYFYQFERLKNWLVILPAIGAYLLLVFAFMGVDQALIFINSHYKLDVELNRLLWDTKSLIFSVFVVLTIMAAFVTYKGLSRSLMGKLISIRLVLISFVLSVLIVFFSNTNDQQLIFVLFTASVLFTNALEAFKKRWIKDLILLVLMVLPFVLVSI